MLPSKALTRYGTGNHNGWKTGTTISDVAIGLGTRNECSHSEETSDSAPILVLLRHAWGFPSIFS